jgi:hypothetical protein
MRPILLATALLTTALLAPPQTVGAAPSPSASIAQFEGGTIDLRNGWGEATACASDGVNTECFRTEDELDQFLTAGETALPLGPLVDLGIQSACATVLKLFSSPSFGGSVLALSTRFAVINLSTWSFSNVTSSYSVGACSSTFYDGANAVPPVYPGNTSAGASAASMLAGWDNRISSVYIS